MIDHLYTVFIGLSVLLLPLSLLVTAIQEFIFQILRIRAATLSYSIKKLLGNSDLENQFFNHPLVSQLFAKVEPKTPEPGKEPPNLSFVTEMFKYGLFASRASYISGSLFALVIADIFTNHPPNVTVQPPLPSSDVAQTPVPNKQGVTAEASAGKGEGAEGSSQTTSSPAKDSLTSLMTVANKDTEKFQTYTAHWFDQAMDRVSGQFNRMAGIVSFVISLAMAIILNINPIDITEQLYKMPPASLEPIFVFGQTELDAIKVSSTVIDRCSNDTRAVGAGGTSPPHIDATGLINCNDALTTAAKKVSESREQLNRALEKIQIKFGWWGGNHQPFDFPSSLIGWLIAAFLMAFGSPFWFDILNKVIAFRSTGPKPAITPHSTKA